MKTTKQVTLTVLNYIIGFTTDCLIELKISLHLIYQDPWFQALDSHAEFLMYPGLTVFTLSLFSYLLFDSLIDKRFWKQYVKCFGRLKNYKWAVKNGHDGVSFRWPEHVGITVLVTDLIMNCREQYFRYLERKSTTLKTKESSIRYRYSIVSRRKNFS